uniref:USP8 dimerisation domain-containing protein n=1 Tax=Globodera rostochiensis TaxID=31243 RepID=A0A914HMI4_GLORO
MDPAKRLMDLVEMAKPRELPASMTMEKCLQILNEIHQLGTFYAEDGHDEEKAFILFLRYISIVVEELPRHPNFFTLTMPERCALDTQALRSMSKAELLKQHIRSKYELEKSEQHKLKQQMKQQEPMLDPFVASTSGSQSSQLLEQQLLSPYVQCQSVSLQPIMFQRLIIPNNIPELFLAQHSLITATAAAADQQQNASEVPLHIAILYGRLVSKSLIVSQLLPCAYDTIQKRDFRRFAADRESGENLPIVGCICSSLEGTSRLGFFRSCQISEMVCIVCAPGPNNTKVFHLVNMSPNGGLSAFHQTTTSGSSSSRTAAAQANLMLSTCAHLHITEATTAKMTVHRRTQEAEGQGVHEQQQQQRTNPGTEPAAKVPSASPNANSSSSSKEQQQAM